MNQMDTNGQNRRADDGGAVRLLDGVLYANMIRGGAAQLRANAVTVNNLNVFPVPDGDTGDNMSMTIEGGVAAIDGMQTADLSELSAKLSQGMLLGARGNSGVILSQFFAGMSKGFSTHESADPYLLGEAMQQGVKQAYAAVMTPTEGTILTVAREAVEYAVSRISESSTLVSVFADLNREMYNSLQHTPELLPALKEANVVDSGGAGLYYIMQGIYRILTGEELDHSEELPEIRPAPKVDFSSFGPDSEMTYGYCTELLLQLQHAKCDIEAFEAKTIADYLGTIGDSIVAFKTESIIKIHVHTRTPEKVLEFCRRYGEFLTVKIENMSVQHSEAVVENGAVSAAEERVQPMKAYGTVAVASGEGIEALFTQLGVDAVVQGGQTQNPSAQDFLAAFEKVNAENIFVFPNNGNIIMAAKQAGQLYEKSRIHVIESKDLGMGYAAISSMNFQADDPEQITEAFNEAMEMVATGYISTAVRDAELNGVHITCGDYIGFVGKEMMVSCPDKVTAAKELLRRMSENEIYLITAFVGKDASPADIEALGAWLGEEYPDVEFYTVDGGQDVYPFIFVVE